MPRPRAADRHHAQEEVIIASTAGALAVELHPHSPTCWTATYYPLNETPAGRWAEVTWPLHRVLLPLAPTLPEGARWLEARSADAGHPCYARHGAWADRLAAGWAAATATYRAAAADAPLSLHDALQRGDVTTIVPAGQLSEWMLHDLEDEITDVRG